MGQSTGNDLWLSTRSCDMHGQSDICTKTQSVTKIKTKMVLLYRLRMKDVFNNKCPLVLRDEGSTDSVKNNR